MSVWRRILLFPLTRLIIWFVSAQIAANLLRLPMELAHLPGSVQLAAEAAGMFLGLVFLAGVVERRPLREAGLARQGMLRDTLIGFVIGGALMALWVGIMALAGWYRIDHFAWNGPVLGGFLYHYLRVGIQEEIAMRGVFFRSVEERLGSHLAIGLSALLFGLMHIMNRNATIASSLAIALGGGIMLAAAYMLTRSLWLAIGIHWGWNFLQGPVFGASASAGPGDGLIRAVVSGPAWATGGIYDPEAGLFAVAICLTAGLLLFMLAHRRGQVIAPFWRRGPEAPQAKAG